MVSIREILVDWTGVQGGGMVSVFNFGISGPGIVTAQREAINDALASLDSVVSSTASWTVRTDGREFDVATGTLTGSWSDSTPYTATGGSIGSAPVPDAAQGLIRWTTDTIVNGRFVRGRTFIPGLRGDMTSGNLSSADITALQTGADLLVSAAVDFGVWHRPQGGAGGALAPVTGASVWSEYAILRRRRK